MIVSLVESFTTGNFCRRATFLLRSSRSARRSCLIVVTEQQTWFRCLVGISQTDPVGKPATCSRVCFSIQRSLRSILVLFCVATSIDHSLATKPVNFEWLTSTHPMITDAGDRKVLPDQISIPYRAPTKFGKTRRAHKFLSVPLPSIVDTI